jgi:hypothetical protein
MRWETIESAPRDGSPIYAGASAKWMKFLFVPYPMLWRWSGQRWVGADGEPYEPQPTHWMPARRPRFDHGKAVRRWVVGVLLAAVWALVVIILASLPGLFT